MAKPDTGAAAARQRSDWAKRHPDAARAERACRKFNRGVQESYGHKVHGTPQTHAHFAAKGEGALARLYMAGDIDAHQLHAGTMIADTHERITRDVAIGTMSMETRVDQSRAPERMHFETLGAVRAEVAYGHWRREIAEPALVLAVIVEGLKLSMAARRFGMRHAKAKRLLIAALDAWEALMREAVRDIDRASLAAAQAGIF